MTCISNIGSFLIDDYYILDDYYIFKKDKQFIAISKNAVIKSNTDIFIDTANFTMHHKFEYIKFNTDGENKILKLYVFTDNFYKIWYDNTSNDLIVEERRLKDNDSLKNRFKFAVGFSTIKINKSNASYYSVSNISNIFNFLKMLTDTANARLCKDLKCVSGGGNKTKKRAKFTSKRVHKRAKLTPKRGYKRARSKTNKTLR